MRPSIEKIVRRPREKIPVLFTAPIDWSRRCYHPGFFKEGVSPHVAGALGTTFFDSRVLATESKLHRTLDHFFGDYTYSTSGRINGFALALADSCGGHVDEAQDEIIARASWFAAKRAVQLVSISEELNVATLDEIVARVADTVRAKARGEESTTLLCARAFWQEDHMRVVGFNIGDGMLIFWSPREQKGRCLLPMILTGGGVAMLVWAKISMISKKDPRDFYALQDEKQKQEGCWMKETL